MGDSSTTSTNTNDADNNDNNETKKESASSQTIITKVVKPLLNENYYFSHMLNCLYDCKYCFLQGMFNSANYLIFVNYEDFLVEIKKILSTKKKRVCFFSGYDCDSLALEKITSFLKNFLKNFKNFHIKFKKFNICNFKITRRQIKTICIFH